MSTWTKIASGESFFAAQTDFTIAGGVASGHHVVVAVWGATTDSDVGTATFSDSAANTYSLDFLDAGTSGKVAFYSGKIVSAIAPGGYLRISTDGANRAALLAYDVTGLDPTSPWKDASGGVATAFSTTQTVSTGGATTIAKEAVFALFNQPTAPTAAGDGCTLLDSFVPAHIGRGTSVFKDVVSTGVQTASITLPSADNGEAAIITYKAAPTGALFDAASSSGYEPALSSYSWSHTCTGTNRGLIVGISIFAAGTVTAITYAGTNLTFLGAIPNGLYRQEFWGMPAPASGTNTIAVTLSTSLTSIGNAISYTGVNQTTPFVDLKPAVGTGNPAAVIVTPATDNDWIVDGIATSDGSIAVGAGQTSRANNSGALGSGAMSDKGPITPASAQTMQWTGIGTLDTWAYLGVAVDPFVDLPVYTPALGIVEIRGEVIPYWVETPAGDLMLMGVGS